MRIKGFDENLRCSSKQYKIGGEYKTKAEHITKDDLCSNKVFHYCDSLKNVDKYYSCQPYHKNRFCEIEALGEEVTDGEIYGTNNIKIVREIDGDELNELRGISKNNGCFNEGRCNYGNTNTGNLNIGHNNSGDFNYGLYNHGKYNFGLHNNNYANIGQRNDGVYNTGHENYGSHNIGYFNKGDDNDGFNNNGTLNSGYSNNGWCNIGRFNHGGHNMGEANGGSNNIGLFCTDETKLRIFNKESNITLEQWNEHPACSIISRLRLTEWIMPNKMTDKEKEENASYAITNGYLKVYEYKEAWQIFWDSLKPEEKATFKTIPNFDVSIFEKITGIKI